MKIRMSNPQRRPALGRMRAVYPLAAAMLLAGCVSFGSEPPPSLLVLTPQSKVEQGTQRSGPKSAALVVLQPNVPRKLATTRVPVQIDQARIAYLTDAVWADKPATLIQQLMAETIAANNGRLVLSNTDAAGKEDEQLSGTLLEFGIEEDTMEAVVVYDAVQMRGGNPVRKKRFEARKSVIEIEHVEAGNALNAAANDVAQQVAEWLSPDTADKP